jgi:uncharacterized YigZ family protein
MVTLPPQPLSQPLLRYRIPAGEAQSELVVKNSVFIGTANHAPTVEAAVTFIAGIRKRYPDANHHAWAYRIEGGSQGAFASSDDGEPGGTAGRPMLAVLEGSGILEVVVVGTRYWGGTKLGTGGLVRAYSDAARQALKAMPTAERRLNRLVTLTIDYALYGVLRYSLPKYGVRTQEQVFTDQVTMGLAVPYEQADDVATLVREMTNGRIDPDKMWHGDCYYTEPVQAG